MAFQEANKGGKYDAVIKNATKFLKGLQDDTATTRTRSSAASATHGKDRPDLSNTQYLPRRPACRPACPRTTRPCSGP